MDYAGATIRIYNVNTGDVTIAAQGTLQVLVRYWQHNIPKQKHITGSDVWLITGTLTS